jgi:hypothetical protein
MNDFPPAMIEEARAINAQYAYEIEKWCVAIESLLKKYGRSDSELEELCIATSK